MSPAEFMNEIVLPTVLEARDARTDRRRAYLACIVVFHVKDHLKSAGATRIEATMRTATGNSFDVVRGVCNGTKHVQTDGTHRVPFVAGADQVRLPIFLGVMRFGRSFFGDTKGGRDILVGNHRHELYGSCATVLRGYVSQYPQHFVGCNLSAL